MEDGATRQSLVEGCPDELRIQPVAPDEDLLELLGRLNPDLLVFASPTGGHLSLLRGLRGAWPRLPILVLSLASTLGSEGFLERLGELAVTRYLTLPIERHEFERRLRLHFQTEGEQTRGASASRRFFRAGELIFLENDLGRECFLVDTGRVCLGKALDRHSLQPVAEAGPGEVFGETALLAARRRTVTAVALQDTLATVLTADNFGVVVQARPRLAPELLDLFVSRHSAARARLDPAASEQLADDWFHQEVSHFASRPGLRPELASQVFAPGQLVLARGESVRSMLWLTQGQVQLLFPGTGGLEPATASVAGPDCPLGELAFLTGEPQETQVTASTEVTALLIPRERFVAAMASRPEVCLELVRSVGNRLQSLNEALGVREVLELA
jgi:CRP-like cAMP-binding protein